MQAVVKEPRPCRELSFPGPALQSLPLQFLVLSLGFPGTVSQQLTVLGERKKVYIDILTS